MWTVEIFLFYFLFKTISWFSIPIALIFIIFTIIDSYILSIIKSENYISYNIEGETYSDSDNEDDENTKKIKQEFKYYNLDEYKHAFKQSLLKGFSRLNVFYIFCRSIYQIFDYVIFCLKLQKLCQCVNSVNSFFNSVFSFIAKVIWLSRPIQYIVREVTKIVSKKLFMFLLMHGHKFMPKKTNNQIKYVLKCAQEEKDVSDKEKQELMANITKILKNIENDNKQL